MVTPCSSSMTKHQVYLSLGSNLGDREYNLREAIRLIGEKVGTVLRQSSFITTEPWGFKSENTFLNAVILCETLLTPREVLQQAQKIEKALGKRPEHATQNKETGNAALKTQDPEPCTQDSEPCTQHSVRYHDRPIDIDILLYDDWKVDEPDLKIPHPLMHKRDFVMIPLNEILISNK